MFKPARFKRKWWLPSGHFETIATTLNTKRVSYTGDIVKTPDNDEVLMCHIAGSPDKPAVVIFHGLEGSAQSHTVRMLSTYFSNKQWSVGLPHFRTCGHTNLLPRAYHAADGDEVRWMLDFFRSHFAGRKLFAVGVSLGGNALIQCLDAGSHAIKAAATVSTPLNLSASAKRMSRGLTHLLYGRHFVKLLRAKVCEKLTRTPAVFNLSLKTELDDAMKRVRTIGDFDEAYTAPLHRFANADAYWDSGSAVDALLRMKTPLLCINAKNDPLSPGALLPQRASDKVVFCRPRHGGHGAFSGTPVNWLGATVHDFFMSRSD